MALPDSGAGRRGYDVTRLVDEISRILDGGRTQRAALVGLGHLGRAILDYFRGRRPNLSISATFDVRADRVGRILQGCRSHHLDALPEVVADQGIALGILTVPADAAQAVAEQMVEAGIRGILNYAPTRLRLPPEIFVENLDMTVSLETVAFFAQAQHKERQRP